MKYAFINRHRRVWPISVQCRVLQASVAGYHEHFVRAASAAQRRHLSDDALLIHIKAIHAATHGGYGWPRTWKELLARGIRVGKQRVQKLMKLHGIRAKGKRRFNVTTDSNHDLPIAPNLLDRQFTVAEPDKVWVGDITYIHTDEGWLFLAVVIDLFCRAPVAGEHECAQQRAHNRLLRPPGSTPSVLTSTSRTARCGPACRVVWEGPVC